MGNTDEPDDTSYPGAMQGQRTRSLEQSDGYYAVARRQIRRSAQKLRTS